MQLLTASNAGTSKAHQGCLHHDIGFVFWAKLHFAARDKAGTGGHGKAKHKKAWAS